jgi:drug/metabolite transporter (DMT)-like permease
MQLAVPDAFIDKIFYFIKLIIFDLYVLSGFLSAFVASLFWMAAISKFTISYAYPFMGLAFVFVMIGSVIFFDEVLSVYKITGTLIVILGLVIITYGD